MSGGDCGTQLFDLKVALKINKKRCRASRGSSQTFGFQSQCQVEFGLHRKGLGPQEEFPIQDESRHFENEVYSLIKDQILSIK